MTQSAVFYVRVIGTIIEALGLLLTVWRIYIRLRIARFWWEDAWAAILLPTGLFWIVSNWLYILANGLTSIVAGWFSSIAFTCIVTFARMSILFSIIRIVHGGPRFLKFTYACVAFFAASWVILIIEKAVQCSSGSRRHTQLVGKPVCLMKAPISIFELTTGCVAVSILVVLPLRMLWRVKLPRRQRRMILSIFASSVVLAFGALFHTVGQILDVAIVTTSGMHVEAALSIIVCNLLVVVTYTYHVLLRNHNDESSKTTAAAEDSPTCNDDDFTTRQRPPGPASTALPLTTVELDVVSLSNQESNVQFKESM